MSGEKGDVWGTLNEEQMARWEEQGGAVDYANGEVAWGDVDTHRVL